ncbi:EF-hand domain-containing protein [Saccharothrix luteola]|uniref:EF-hand domain-containing protein n=1 Tax=Saccharothrix luteola TaxID=2893018 RepID=UPI0022A88980|nr:EF-hand domain-containing protein [Saccharothrix luteola]MCC8246009.1 EF-hand domain-containing protein [Saccharothrix luteola]
MSGDLRMDNVDRAFAVFDVDGDGGISWEDFSAAARGVGREFGLGVESSEVRALVGAYRAVWGYIVGADLDADGSVSRAEFRGAHESGRLSTGELVEKWLVVAGRNFEVADRDGDGFLDGSEFAGIYRGSGVTDPQVAAIAFAGMDVDGNGRVDRAEFLTNVRGFFTAEDGSVKGARMLSEG